MFTWNVDWKKKQTICQGVASVAQLTFVEWRFALKKERKKLWKQISWCKEEDIFYDVEEEKK